MNGNFPIVGFEGLSFFAQFLCRDIINFHKRMIHNSSFCVFFSTFAHKNCVHMQWNKEALKESRVKAKLSQTSLAKELGIHFRTVQNWEKGITPIPTSVYLALDKILNKLDSTDYVSREEYNRVVAALDASTELNKKLTDIIQSGLGNDAKQ